MADRSDVKAKADSRKSLHLRQDADEDLLNLEPYVMKDAANKPVDDVINITLPTPALFSEHVNTSMTGATQQAKVSGNDVLEEVTNEVERFLRAYWQEVDRWLVAMGDPELRPFLTEQVNMRGEVATRMTNRILDDGRFYPQVLEIDTRFLTYEYSRDGKGLEWAAYETFRTAAQINSEYGTNFATRVEPYTIIDLWDRGVNKIYFHDGTTPIREQVNPWGYVPFNIRRVPVGSNLLNKDREKRRGESIMHLIREVYDELNRLMTIMQTLNMLAVKGGQEFEHEEGTKGKLPRTNPAKMGNRTAVPLGGGTKLVPTGDLKAAGRQMLNVLQTLEQAASLPLSEFGGLQGPMSAIALIELGESSNKVFAPRLGTKGMLYVDMAVMALRQIATLGKATLEMGTLGHMQTFKLSDMEGRYDIMYQYFIKSPKTDAARYAVADQASKWAPKSVIGRDILQFDNPEEMERLKALEDAEELYPEIKLYNDAKRYIAEDRPVEAQIIANKLGLSLRDIEAGKVAPHQKPKPEPARNLGSGIFDEGTQAAQRQRTELQTEPAEEE